MKPFELDFRRVTRASFSDPMRRVTAVLRLSAWAAISLIALLSLVPGQDRPHVLASGQFEHFTAYFLASTVLTLAYKERIGAVRIALFLSGYSGVLEIFQLWIPGRVAQISDFAISSLGSCLGVLLASIVLTIYLPPARNDT
jgi:VanZ family protein